MSSSSPDTKPGLFSLARARMLDFLAEIEASGKVTACLYLPACLSSSQVERSTEEFFGLHRPPLEAVKLASRSKTGSVLFVAPSELILVLPPFPVTRDNHPRGQPFQPLRALLESDYLIGLVLIRLGAYAVGVCHGEKLIDSKVGTGLVHARHRQGGSSQARFQRHREKQIEYFLTRVCGHVREHLEPQAKILDYLAFGGSWTAILELQKKCPFLQQLKVPILHPLLEIEEPRKDVLEKAVSRVWASHVFQWPLDDSLD